MSRSHQVSTALPNDPLTLRSRRADDKSRRIDNTGPVDRMAQRGQLDPIAHAAATRLLADYRRSTGHKPATTGKASTTAASWPGAGRTTPADAYTRYTRALEAAGPVGGALLVAVVLYDVPAGDAAVAQGFARDYGPPRLREALAAIAPHYGITSETNQPRSTGSNGAGRIMPRGP